LLLDPGAACGARQNHRRLLGWRTRCSGLRKRFRRAHRKTHLENLHRARSKRAGWRHLERRDLQRGGGSTWITGVYDPASNTTYWGTGNPGPWVADDRPGDNLYTDSTLALDADTGKIKSYHQYTPHDSWDWDEVSAPLLIDTEVDGKLTKTATHAGRNGYLWILDRDRLKFLHAFPFANNNVFTSIDPKTGRPAVDESKRPGAHQGAEFCPSIGGGKDWPPEAWSPQTKLLYIPANDNICAYLPKGEVPEANSKGFYVGYEVESIFGSVRTSSGASEHIGELQAWDLNTGKRVWQHNFKTMLWSPLLVTGGNILFAGGPRIACSERLTPAVARNSWSFPLPSGAIGVPTSFAIDGEQYVAVTTGWDLDARGRSERPRQDTRHKHSGCAGRHATGVQGSLTRTRVGSNNSPS